MAITLYRGFNLKTSGDSKQIWQVQIKESTLVGSLNAIKKSVDWYVETNSIIDPREFENVGKRPDTSDKAMQEDFNGFTLKNDTGEANGWYCFFNGRLIKGSRLALERHIQAYLIAKKKAQQQQQQKK
ncbi:DUF3319 domain-containing protein [Vibrio marisflavi]|uniref:DUF3319 domain-containing protein n=1 Tax=Vibrio marisflavi CECT 7928 TaxID=634439 RepID=A0ABM9A097_9VIBR|nr:DUF3319 domain-containing protein [Vibrio marisflavi]CAH0536862.1 hypothetical protein VMF7928_00753 [Vibrio marisflavi CECT 7928]